MTQTASHLRTVFPLLLTIVLFLSQAQAQNSRSGYPADPESKSMLRRFPCGGMTILDERFSADSIPGGWEVLDEDAFAPNNNILFLTPVGGWQSVVDFKDIDSVNRILASPSWYQDTTGASDDYLILPKTFIPENVCLSWYAYSQDKFFPESYEIRVSTTTPDPTGFLANPALLTVSAEGDAFTYRSISLNAYAGEEVYIAFRHTSVNKFILALDDIRLAQVEKRDVAMFYLDDITGGADDDITISGAVINAGLDTLGFDTLSNPMIISYQINDGDIKIDTVYRTFTFLPNDTIQFVHDSLWTPATDDVYKFKVWVSGFGADDVAENDSITRWQGIGSRTAIDAGLEDMGIRLYPNPVNEMLSIEFTTPANADYQIEWYDLAGHRVLNPATLKEGQTLIELPSAGLLPGLYLIHLIPEDGRRFSRKVIVR